MWCKLKCEESGCGLLFFGGIAVDGYEMEADRTVKCMVDKNSVAWMAIVQKDRLEAWMVCVCEVSELD